MNLIRIYGVLLFVGFTFVSWGQKKGVIFGKKMAISHPDWKFQYADTTQNLTSFDCIFIFSTAQKSLDSITLSQLKLAVEQGTNIYIGSENWPFVAESNQVTTLFFNKSMQLMHDVSMAEVNTLTQSDRVFSRTFIPAGTTTSSFPLDYRLKVEAWTVDDPLILSGKIGLGKLIIDGGYSRFYSENWDAEVELVWNELLDYLE
jgi:hypothetical protein